MTGTGSIGAVPAFSVIEVTDLPTVADVAGTYGPSSSTTVGYGGTIAVPEITVDSYGRITGVTGRNINLPAEVHQTIKQDGITGATVNRYGTCSTAAGTAAKTVTITAGTFNLEAGARVTIKFSNKNTANSPTLNVNGKGAKNIFHRGAQITTGVNKELLNGVVEFIYDGTQWHLIGDTWYTVGTTSADDITAWTANTPSVVTKKTVVTGGSTTNVPNVTSVGSTPSLTISSVDCDDITSWNAGTATTSTYSNGIVSVTSGTAPSLTYSAKSVGSASGWNAGAVPTLGTAIKAYTSLSTGDSVSVTAGTAASLSYTARTVLSSITGS
jgi:hypothetical protein